MEARKATVTGAASRRMSSTSSRLARWAGRWRPGHQPAQVDDAGRPGLPGAREGQGRLAVPRLERVGAAGPAPVSIECTR